MELAWISVFGHYAERSLPLLTKFGHRPKRVDFLTNPSQKTPQDEQNIIPRLSVLLLFAFAVSVRGWSALISTQCSIALCLYVNCVVQDHSEQRLATVAPYRMKGVGGCMIKEYKLPQHGFAQRQFSSVRPRRT